MAFIRAVKKKSPWWFKVFAKLILARLPIPYVLWKRLGVFEHGDMGKAAYALNVFLKHFNAVDFPARQRGFVALELGPGDSLLSAPVAFAHGSEFTYLVDAGEFASPRITASYQELSVLLAEHGLALPARPPTSREELLSNCSATYLVEGLESLRSIPAGSVDLAFSHASLEHIRRAEFLPAMLELRRTMKPDGVGSHQIDLKDHLGGALNNLRLRSSVWESKIFSSSGFYTNRLRYSEILQIFDQAGFGVELVNVNRWPSLPTPREKLAKEFRDFREDDLLVSGFHAVLRPRNS